MSISFSGTIRSICVTTMLCGLATAASAETITVTDDRGVGIAVPQPIERLASVSYFAADLAVALGRDVVASTYMVEGRSPDFLAGALDDVIWLGQRASPNLELLSEARPDLVVAIRRYTEGAADEIAKIAPYLAYDLELFTDSDAKILELGKALGETDAAEALNAAFRADQKDYAARAPKDSHPRFAVMWGGEAPWVFRNENMTASILIGLGGENIAGPNPTPEDPTNWGVELSWEEILVQDPEVLFIYDYGPDRPHEGNPVWPLLSAVKNNRVHYVGDHWVETHGPLAREMVLREGANFLYPDTFPAVDVRDEAAKLITTWRQ